MNVTTRPRLHGWANLVYMNLGSVDRHSKRMSCLPSSSCFFFNAWPSELLTETRMDYFVHEFVLSLLDGWLVASQSQVSEWYITRVEYVGQWLFTVTCPKYVCVLINSAERFVCTYRWCTVACNLLSIFTLTPFSTQLLYHFSDQE